MEILKTLKQLGFKQSFIEDLKGWHYLEKLLVEPPKGTDAHNQGLKIGDTVRFKNDYGVMFYGQRIIGFGEHTGLDRERCVYTDSDAFWFASYADQFRVHTASDWVIHAMIEASKHADNRRDWDSREEAEKLGGKVQKSPNDNQVVSCALDWLADYDKKHKTDFLQVATGGK
ncbi:TPA: hypothetical protein ACF33U_004179 [Vibrio parahaemolyticus]